MVETRSITIKGQISEIADELQDAATHLKNVTQAVSIFGSARIKQDDPFYILTTDISRKLASAGFTIISGGGPGIMEAANKGAHEVNGNSIGLNIKLPNETTNNPFQSQSIYFKYFVSRKTTFFMNSWAYIIMPGGFGTMDELFEALTLVQTGKANRAPIVLVGTSFWTGLIEFIKNNLLGNGYISAKDIDLISVTDDADLVLDIVSTYYDEHHANPHCLGLC
ncbi:TIGR00730 family Rossman fold protein [Taylorella equigenitalis]|uniref:Cytokinin riboside 5'-monophosphate phosphoribohydrolase n=3 Tax=Taylorella equigenitalis TaxID=29575 RepID=A0A654KF61_TAYEM|nr:TIGR00730 family Rossman fold protein [Taylorella equigenitalis]ADU91052.1 hypothetical protein TEQUI_0096 [Taylorella equigenitalis MCE9]AFN36155.1 hypothetical protein KUI_1090 [Taylorella equigenitalis ATCC 35865]ASY30785.1 Rossman fold protein, TIGR00730 family [Taylorella equigenitalis]ASY38087.1 TIGR00730 family Rossman fold protein [Taylorella equigenitalis]ASY39562.1 Rossman fold protein, TIGR00730 family [Taylorella equigenitalis]